VSRHDSYRGVGRHYDLHGWDWYAGTSGSRLVALLRERGVPAGARVLDVGCGTGSLALLLAREGFRVTGVDLSPGMLARARAKDPTGEVDWRLADATALDLGGTFDAAVSVADVFNHLESLDAWEEALSQVRAHLRPGGLVFVDAMTCRGLEQMDVQSVQERGGITLILSIIYEPAARRSTLKVVSYVPAPGGEGLYERAAETITEWGQPVEETLRRFERAGFRDVRRVWTTTEDPEDEDRLTVVGVA